MSSHMVVPATNFTFFNFHSNCFPCPCSPNHLRNFSKFYSSHMVELENHNICFSTINTRVYFKIAYNSLLILFDLFLSTTCTGCYLRFFIILIPYFIIRHPQSMMHQNGEASGIRTREISRDRGAPWTGLGHGFVKLERSAGIEPALKPWQGLVLPIYEDRNKLERST